MTRPKKPSKLVPAHWIRMTIQFESDGFKDVTTLLEKIRKCKPAAFLTREATGAVNGASTYTTDLHCNDADTIVRKVKAGLFSESAITRISMRIRYGLESTAPQAYVNLLA